METDVYYTAYLVNCISLKWVQSKDMNLAGALTPDLHYYFRFLKVE